MMSAAEPWIGALIACRCAKAACGPRALISGAWMRRPNSVSTWPCSLAKAMVRFMYSRIPGNRSK